MEDAKVQKPRIEALFCGTKVIQLLSYLRMKFKTDFIHRGVSSCIHREYFLKCERQQLCYEILRQLQVKVKPMKNNFIENKSFEFEMRSFGAVL